MGERIHGLAKRGEQHPLFKTWVEMRYRCEKPHKDNYKHYGGRGIKVCERWQNFANFVADMGERPEGATLDRIDHDGNYSPENCRWASAIQQMNNMRTNRLLTIDGEQMTMADAARKWGLSTGTVWNRLKLGWTESDAVKRPLVRGRPR